MEKTMFVRDRLQPFKDKIIQDYYNGKKTVELGKEYNCNAGSIWLLLKEWKVNVTKKQRYFEGQPSDYTKEILEDFDNGISAYKIGLKLKIYIGGIIKVLKDNGRDTSRGYTIDDSNKLIDKKDIVIQRYHEGMSCATIAKELGYSEASVWHLLDKEGLELKTFKYNINDTFFDEINTQDKAYVFGLALADGNTRFDGKFRIALKVDDIDILEKVKKVMKYEGPLLYRKGRKTADDQIEFCVNRQRLTQKLIEKGCVPAKSMILKFPTEDIIPNHLLHHMMRGYADGDGSITKHYCNIVGNLSFITDFSKILDSLGIYHNIYQRYKDRKPEDSSHQLFIGRKEERIKYLRWLYKDSNISLDRKRAKALEIVPDLFG